MFAMCVTERDEGAAGPHTCLWSNLVFVDVKVHTKVLDCCGRKDTITCPERVSIKPVKPFASVD